MRAPPERAASTEGPEAMSDADNSKREEVWERIRERCANIESQAKKQLRRRQPRAGESEQGARTRAALMQEVITLADGIGQGSLEGWPQRAARELEDELKEMQSAVEALHGARAGTLGDVVAALDKQLYACFKRNWANVAAVRGGTRALEERVKEVLEAEEAFKAELDQRKSETDEVMEYLRKARSNELAIEAYSAVAPFTEAFEKEEKRHHRLARHWLVAGAAAIAGTAGLIAAWITATSGMLAMASQGANLWAQYIAASAPWAASVSLAWYASAWLARQSRTHTHLAAVNGHRAKSITTVRPFSAAAGDRAVRDALLLEAARAVFAHVPTGLGMGEGETRGPALSVIELLQSKSDGKAP